MVQHNRTNNDELLQFTVICAPMCGNVRRGVHATHARFPGITLALRRLPQAALGAHAHARWKRAYGASIAREIHSLHE